MSAKLHPHNPAPVSRDPLSLEIVVHRSEATASTFWQCIGRGLDLGCCFADSED